MYSCMNCFTNLDFKIIIYIYIYKFQLKKSTFLEAAAASWAGELVDVDIIEAVLGEEESFNSLCSTTGTSPLTIGDFTRRYCLEKNIQVIFKKEEILYSYIYMSWLRSLNQMFVDFVQRIFAKRNTTQMKLLEDHIVLSESASLVGEQIRNASKFFRYRRRSHYRSWNIFVSHHKHRVQRFWKISKNYKNNIKYSSYLLAISRLTRKLIGITDEKSSKNRKNDKYHSPYIP